MEFKKIVTTTLYAKQKKRHRCTEQTFRLCGRRQGWDVQREQHWNKYSIKGETDHQPRLNPWEQVLRAGVLGRPRGMGWGGRREGGSGWGTRVNPWLICVNVWQKPLQYFKVISLQLMAGWHNGLDGHESEWPPGVGDGQGGLACCDSLGRKESDTTERLNWTELNKNNWKKKNKIKAKLKCFHNILKHSPQKDFLIVNSQCFTKYLANWHTKWIITSGNPE